MNFEDSQMASDRDYAIMKQNFDKIHTEETNDLHQILQKMQEQLEYLERNNANGQYNEIISKFESNIRELNNIINSSRVSSHQISPIIPNLSGIIRVSETDEAISPIRSSDEIASHNSQFNQIPTETPTTQKRKRNSPLQGDIWSSFARAFQINPHKKCEPRQKFIDSQIDIIRALLLYLMLRPNCKYTSRISYIANEQFDILLYV